VPTTIRHGRKAVLALVAGSLLMLAACGEDPKPAAGADQSSSGGSGAGTMTPSR
jgi:hypothetical protein